MGTNHDQFGALLVYSSLRNFSGNTLFLVGASQHLRHLFESIELEAQYFPSLIDALIARKRSIDELENETN